MDGYNIFSNKSQYVIKQNGSGLECLCQKCNNDTGGWYGKSYIDFAEKIEEYIDDIMLSNRDNVDIKHIFPLQIIKQICSMFCSINCDDKRIDELRRFVLEKETVGINTDKFKILMGFTNNEEFVYVGLHEDVDICFSIKMK